MREQSSNVNWDFVIRSKAKNSYELLSEVIQQIENEYSCVYMNDYVRCTGDDVLATKNRTPQCGTQGCISGWCAILRTPRYFESTNAFLKSINRSPSDYTDSELMPYEYDSAFSNDWDRLTLGEKEYPFPSTSLSDSAYAQAVIVNIRKFQAKWEDTLKAHKLPEIGEE